MQRPEIVLATKVNLRGVAAGDFAAAVARSIDASLGRLGRSHVDLFQLHNAIGDTPHPSDVQTLPVDVELGEVVPALARAREQGKTRFIGITGLGHTDALR